MQQLTRLTLFFFLKDPATPEIYPLPLHDALPISAGGRREVDVVHAGARAPDHPQPRRRRQDVRGHLGGAAHGERVVAADDLAQLGRLEPDLEVRSEKHTSELQSQSNLVCRLLLEK